MPNRYVTHCTSKVACASYIFSIHSVTFHWKIFVSAMRKGIIKTETSVTRCVLIWCFHWNRLKGIQHNICTCTSQRMDSPWQPWSLVLSCRQPFGKELQSKSWKSERKQWVFFWLWSEFQVWSPGSGILSWQGRGSQGDLEKKQWRTLWMLC